MQLVSKNNDDKVKKAQPTEGKIQAIFPKGTEFLPQAQIF